MMFIKIALLFWLPLQPLAHATSEIDACRLTVTKQLSVEHRLFRSVLYGEPTPEAAPIGHITFSNAGDSWMKISDTEWKSLAPGFSNTTWFNTQLEQQTAIPARRGIFETKRVLTSDLVPYITNNMRTFDCRVRMFCEAVLRSTSQNDPQSLAAASSASSANPSDELEIRISGCAEKTLPVVTECASKKAGVEQSNLADAFSYCSTIASELYEREKALIALSTEYDAAYRSTVQFAGDFDLFIEQLRWPMTNTIRQAASVIGSLHRIPCFLASCEDFPLPHQNEQ